MRQCGRLRHRPLLARLVAMPGGHGVARSRRALPAACIARQARHQAIIVVRPRIPVPLISAPLVGASRAAQAWRAPRHARWSFSDKGSPACRARRPRAGRPDRRPEGNGMISDTPPKAYIVLLLILIMYIMCVVGHVCRPWQRGGIDHNLFIYRKENATYRRKAESTHRE